MREQHDVLDEDPGPPEITEGLGTDGGEQASLELSETERDLLVIAPELLETIRPVPSLGREIHNRLSDHNVDQTVGQAKDSEYQSGDPGNIVPASEGQAVQSPAIIEIRSCARTIAARSRQWMVLGDHKRNPPPNYPPGTFVTLRIPKKESCGSSKLMTALSDFG